MDVEDGDTKELRHAARGWHVVSGPTEAEHALHSPALRAQHVRLFCGVYKQPARVLNTLIDCDLDQCGLLGLGVLHLM